jgi:predicted cobalt transporter CbtA
MPFRLGAAAMMAAILATLTVLVARAVIDPPVVPDIAGRESFLFQHLALAVGAALSFQLAFWAAGGLPGYRGGLRWGAGGFIAAVVAPLLAMPHLPTGAVPLHDGGALLFWLTTVAVTGLGLWLLLRGGGPLRGDWRGRAVGGLLLVLPVLLAPRPVRPGELADGSPGAAADPLAAMAAGGDTALMLGLNLLFWLALGLASVLAARRVVHRTG